jgi:hypothetical protein
MNLGTGRHSDELTRSSQRFAAAPVSWLGLRNDRHLKSPLPCRSRHSRTTPGSSDCEDMTRLVENDHRSIPPIHSCPLRRQLGRRPADADHIRMLEPDRTRVRPRRSSTSREVLPSCHGYGARRGERALSRDPDRPLIVPKYRRYFRTINLPPPSAILPVRLNFARTPKSHAGRMIMSTAPSRFTGLNVLDVSAAARVRVARARTLMSNTSESLSQIARACGLVDQAHLGRCFFRVMGVAPGTWRRNHAIGPQSAGLPATADQDSCAYPRYSFPGEAGISS